MLFRDWKYIKSSADGKFKSYIRIKGTSEYDTREMANFLDLIIEDCKQQGIETMTPEELLKLKGYL